MIPASYLFKEVYAHEWQDTDLPTLPQPRTRFLDGLTTPIAAAVSAVLHRRPDHSYVYKAPKTSW